MQDNHDLMPKPKADGAGPENPQDGSGAEDDAEEDADGARCM